MRLHREGPDRVYLLEVFGGSDGVGDAGVTGGSDQVYRGEPGCLADFLWVGVLRAGVRLLTNA